MYFNPKNVVFCSTRFHWQKNVQQMLVCMTGCVKTKAAISKKTELAVTFQCLAASMMMQSDDPQRKHISMSKTLHNQPYITIIIVATKEYSKFLAISILDQQLPLSKCANMQTQHVSVQVSCLFCPRVTNGLE